MHGVCNDRSDIIERLRAGGCVFAEDEADLLLAAASSTRELRAMVAQRASGMPLEYVVGWAEFCDARVHIEPGVFIPRPRTEFLVREAVARACDIARPVVLDLCCGSGALGIAIARMTRAAPARRATASGDTPARAAAAAPARAAAAAPARAAALHTADPRAALRANPARRATAGELELHATDLDPRAVRCARRNITPGIGSVYEGDLFDALPATLRGRVNLIVANVPYVPTEMIPFLPADTQRHEQPLLLDGGADGLDVARRVAAGTPHWLAPGGHVFIEVAATQAPVLARCFATHGLHPEILRSDEHDATLVAAQHLAHKPL